MKKIVLNLLIVLSTQQAASAMENSSAKGETTTCHKKVKENPLAVVNASKKQSKQSRTTRVRARGLEKLIRNNRNNKYSFFVSTKKESDLNYLFFDRKRWVMEVDNEAEALCCVTKAAISFEEKIANGESVDQEVRMQAITLFKKMVAEHPEQVGNKKDKKSPWCLTKKSYDNWQQCKPHDQSSTPNNQVPFVLAYEYLKKMNK